MPPPDSAVNIHTEIQSEINSSLRRQQIVCCKYNRDISYTLDFKKKTHTAKKIVKFKNTVSLFSQKFVKQPKNIFKVQLKKKSPINVHESKQPSQ